MGWAMRDVLLTREEIAGLMANLLVTTSLPAGTTKLSDWAREHAATSAPTTPASSPAGAIAASRYDRL